LASRSPDGRSARVAFGERILKAAPALQRVAALVRSTHERWDGAGYPDGLSGEDIPLAALKEQAYAIYTYLSAVPHLFPSETKPVTSPDGSPPATAATAAVWDDFDAFYGRAMAAANDAYDASQAADIAKFRTLAMQLRMDCDSCHAKYMHVFDPTTGK